MIKYNTGYAFSTFLCGIFVIVQMIFWYILPNWMGMICVLLCLCCFIYCARNWVKDIKAR